MAGEFDASPGELRRVASDLDEVSTAINGVMSTLRAQLAASTAAGPPWAWSECSQVVDGPNGIEAQIDRVFGSLEAKTGLLDYYSDFLRQAADE